MGKPSSQDLLKEMAKLGATISNPICRVCLRPTDKPSQKYHDSCRQNKYHALATVIEVAGEQLRFHSKAEAERFGELYLLWQAGKISFPARQVPFPLTVNGILVATYRADFVYLDHENDDAQVVEDKKGHRDDYFKLKARLFKACYGFSILET